MSDASDAIHVALIEPEIHWNTGNAGRTCLAVGATLHLIEPFGFSIDDREVRRAGLDYWPRVSLKTWPSFDVFEQEIPELGTPYFFSPDADRAFWDVRFEPPLVLLFGSETKGFTPELRERYRERLVSIPIHDGSVRALNLSTSVGIAIFEVLRQIRSRER